jgi:primary-amine oxidase
MESLNAVILNPPLIAGDPYTFEDYDVKQEYTCIPEAPAAFEYRDPEVYDHDGQKMDGMSVEQWRKGAELFHRIAWDAPI